MGSVWRDWVVNKQNVDSPLAAGIARRTTELNVKISDSLGTQFRIGHSYVTPTEPLEAGGTQRWFTQVVETEIGPLLEEYWFDAPKLAKEACEHLMQGW